MDAVMGLLRTVSGTVRRATLLASLCVVLAFATAGLAWRSVELGARAAAAADANHCREMKRGRAT